MRQPGCRAAWPGTCLPCLPTDLLLTCVRVRTVARVRPVAGRPTATPQDHSIFPANLYVRKLSGSGQDSIFSGRIR